MLRSVGYGDPPGHQCPGYYQAPHEWGWLSKLAPFGPIDALTISTAIGYACSLIPTLRLVGIGKLYQGGSVPSIIVRLVPNQFPLRNGHLSRKTVETQWGPGLPLKKYLGSAAVLASLRLCEMFSVFRNAYYLGSTTTLASWGAWRL